MQLASDYDPTNVNLKRTAGYLHASRSYLENRFYQVAERATQQYDRPSQPTAADFAVVYTCRIPKDSALPETVGTVGVTYADIAHWFDAVADSDYSYKSGHELRIYISPGKKDAKDLASNDACRIIAPLIACLKTANEVDSDFSLTRHLPITFEYEKSFSTSAFEKIGDVLSCTQERSKGETYVFPSKDVSEGCEDQSDPITSAEVLPSPLAQTAEEPVTKGKTSSMTKEVANTFMEAIAISTTYNNLASIALDETAFFSSVDLIGPAEVSTLATNSRSSRRPIPPSAYLEVIGYQDFMNLACDAQGVLRNRPANGEVNSFLDVRAYLQEETPPQGQRA